MELCNTYTNLTECALTLQNTYNLKLIILVMFIFISIAMIHYAKEINIKTSIDIYKKLLMTALGYLYLGSLPLMSLTLRHTVNFEIFVIALVSIYFVGLTVVLGGALLYGTQFFFNLFGLEAFDVKEMNKYKNDKY